MARLIEKATLADGPAVLMTGLGAPLYLGGRLYVTSASGGGVLALDAQDLSILDQYDFTAFQGGLGAERQLYKINDTTLLASGQRSPALELITLDGKGNFLSSKILSEASFPRAVDNLLAVKIAQETYFLVSSRFDAGLSLWKTNELSALSKVTQKDPPSVMAAEMAEMVHMTIGGRQMVYTLSARRDEIRSYELSQQGQLIARDTFGKEEGLAIDQASALQSLTVGATNYLLMGSAGTSSIVVAAVQSNGTLKLTDHIMDDLNTRFSKITALTTVKAGEQTYIAAAGADKGISLFTLLPNGKLVLVDTLAGGGDTALNTISGLEAHWTGTTIDFYVTGTMGNAISGSAVSRISYDLGANPRLYTLTGTSHFSAGDGADILFSNGGHILLKGGGGDDILIDGPGSDTLVGGTGADLFVFRPDKFNDVILDFNPEMDRIDISQLGAYYTHSAMKFKTTAKGAELTIAGFKITINSHDGQPIAQSKLRIEDLRGPTHISLIPPEKSDDLLIGTPFRDHLGGDGGADTLIGMQDKDSLFGGSGDDVLIGGTIYDDQEQGLAQIYRLYQAALNRPADEAGLISWNGLISSGKNTIQQTATGFIQSPEFLRTYGQADDGEYVKLLYNNVLGRDPDKGGFTNWTKQLASGMSREDVLIGFSDSAENISRTEIGAMFYGLEGLQTYSIPETFRFYIATLNRAPDLAGLLDWSAQLAAGRPIEEIVHGFIASTEFQKRYGTTEGEDFITLIYRNILGREPDKGGLINWVNYLAQTGRNEVVLGMMKSNEFLKKTAPVIKAWMSKLGDDDYLSGGSGDNLLFGGLYRDTFVFNAEESSTNKVYRLEPWDVLEMKGFGYTKAADVGAHLKDTYKGAVFSDEGVDILFVNTTAQEVMAADFLF